VSVPQGMRKQFLDRFDKLVTDGTQIRDSMRVWPETTAGRVTSLHSEVSDPQRLSKWETNCLTLFDTFTKQGTKLKERVDEFSHASDTTGVKFCLGILEAFREDFDQGFLDDLLLKLEAEVAADYMGWFSLQSVLRAFSSTAPARTAAGTWSNCPDCPSFNKALRHRFPS
jgi:hypothetical protein